MEKYDVAVIGGGPAGYVAAIKAAQMNGRVVLFEKDTVGGTCLNRGCIPTKTYLKTAEYIHHIRGAGQRGIRLASSDFTMDMEAVLAGKNRVVKTLTSGVAGLLSSNRVVTVKGEASLTPEKTVVCGGALYAAKNIILCGGSKAGTLPIPGMEDNPQVITSDEILDMTAIPKRLAVIGGGVIGCEMATVYAAFGSEVTIIELTDRLVPAMDKEISDSLKRSLERQGVRVLLSHKVERIDGTLVFLEGESEPVEADKILLSIGRVADLECLGGLSETIDVESGYVRVDSFMRTKVPGIYAAGDITGLSMLAHAAFKMGEVAAANAMGHEIECDLSKVPGCLYTLPEAASVGLTEAEAQKIHEISVGKFPFGANGRALASGEPDGFVKVLAEKKYGEILGVHIFGGAATEAIAEAAALMSMEITVHETADMIHAHPTFSEALMEACADALGRCIHLPPKNR